MGLINGVDLWRAIGEEAGVMAHAQSVKSCLYPIRHMDAYVLFRKQPGARKVRRLLRRQQQRGGWHMHPRSGVCDTCGERGRR